MRCMSVCSENNRVYLEHDELQRKLLSSCEGMEVPPVEVSHVFTLQECTARIVALNEWSIMVEKRLAQLFGRVNQL
jgi:hypothetical protein